MKDAPAPEMLAATGLPGCAASVPAVVDGWPAVPASLPAPQAARERAVDRASRAVRIGVAFIGLLRSKWVRDRAVAGCRHEMMFLLQPYDAAPVFPDPGHRVLLPFEQRLTGGALQTAF